MKIFHFLVQIAIFRAFLLFSERFSSCISARIKCSSQTVYGRNARRKSPEKRRNVLKMAVLTKKSKIFIKAKLTASKSCLLGLVYSMICCILRDFILLSLDLHSLSFIRNAYKERFSWLVKFFENIRNRLVIFLKIKEHKS